MTNRGEHRAEPSINHDDPPELLLDYLDFCRDVVLSKLDGLTDEQLRSSRLPSGWSPLGLLKHLAYMERRWLCWGFAGEQVSEPWGDRDPAGDGWRLDETDTVDGLRVLLMEQRARTNATVARSDLATRAAQGGRFATSGECPTLAWILFHVLQEYARHVGHLDIARELIDGSTGE